MTSDPFDHNKYKRSKTTVESINGTDNAVVSRERHEQGFVLIPAQIAARMTGATESERAVVWCLVELRYKQRKWNHGGPLSLTNVALKKFDVSRWSKISILDKLKARGILTYAKADRQSVKVLVHSKFWR